MNATIRLRHVALIIALMLCAFIHAEDEPKPEKDDDAPVKRAAKASENGMELFSWHVKGEEVWHFALLPAPGVEKLKSVEFVTSKENALDGPAALKKKLAALAISEKVGWFNMLDKKESSAGDAIFDFPPKEIVKELELYCTALKVRLNIYQTRKTQ